MRYPYRDYPPVLHMAPRACGEAPFCIGRLCQGIGALFRGLIPIPFLLRRLRRSRVYGGFVFAFGFACAVVSRHPFSFSPGVGSFVRWFRFCAWLFACVCATYSARASKLTTFLEICGNIANSASPVCPVWEAFRVC